jgi:hypothetical protein
MLGMLHSFVVPTHRPSSPLNAGCRNGSAWQFRARTIYVRERLIFASFLNQDAGPQGPQALEVQEPEEFRHIQTLAELNS